jgi:lipid A disaccharide synthetase
VVYYISPQVWDGKRESHSFKKYVDRMITILPFEKEFYAKYDYEVDYVGHPLWMNCPKRHPLTMIQLISEQLIISQKRLL